MSVFSERDEIERAIADYEREGYIVERDVNTAILAPGLRNLRIDFVARRDDLVVIVEVTHRAAARESAWLVDVAMAAETIPNTRVDVVWTGEPGETPSDAAVSMYLDRGHEVYFKDSGAGLLLAWAAVECALRKLAEGQQIAQTGSTDRQVMADLYGNGIISWSAYSLLNRLSRARNAVASARIDSSTEFSEYDFISLRLYCEFFNSPTFVPFEDVLAATRAQVTHDVAALMLKSDSFFGRHMPARLLGLIPSSMPDEDIKELLSHVARAPVTGQHADADADPPVTGQDADATARGEEERGGGHAEVVTTRARYRFARPGLFGRRGGGSAALLPRNTVALLDEYGRWRYDAASYVPSGVRPGVEDRAFYQGFMQASQSDPERFVRELADLVADRGDWATVGASRLVTEELNAIDRDDPNYHRLMRATQDFFDRRGELPNSLTGFEADYFRRHGR